MSISTPKSARHLADGAAERPERQVAVLFAVADDDVAAAAPHQLVQPQVVEVAAVREVDEPLRAVVLAPARPADTSAQTRVPARRLACCQRGLPSHQPSRASKTVSRNAIGPDVE